MVEGADLPFRIQRYYYIYNLRRGGRRGGHAHRTEEELIVVPCGGIRISLDDGRRRGRVVLKRPDRALYIPAMIWHELEILEDGSVCTVLASQPYDVDDYFDDYRLFAHAAHRLRSVPAGLAGVGDRHGR